MLWFRVEIDKRGKVASCRQVDAAGTAGGSVFYVSAASAEAAHREAGRIYGRNIVREKRARWRSQGLCTECGGKPERRPDGGSKRRCRLCLERERVYRDRHDARAAGKKVEPLPVGGRPAHQTREKRDLLVRIETLLEVQKMWFDCPNVGRFSAELNAAIERLRAELGEPALKKAG